MKTGLLILVGLVALTLPSVAFADAFSFSGNASGSFSGGSTVGFYGFSFGGPIGEGLTDLKLGTFDSNREGVFGGEAPWHPPTDFQLQITFSLENGAGEQASFFTAIFNGTVIATGDGGFVISFGTVPQVFSFGSGNQSGTIELQVMDTSGAPSDSLIGRLAMQMNSPAGVPDGGATVALLGAACLAMAALRKKLRA